MIKQLSEALAALLPPGAGGELRANMDAVLRAHLRELDLTTREDFAVQEKVLQRTRERVSELEREVAALEKELELRPPGGAGE
ncbi:MAG: accessory factor UbiK family protein [Gammaproteobacteria bacterium]|nr:accessory factor UbiK family protein [Gammaproteobacteria bacterium]MDA8006885.1 accessory factor UbiK family protein [Gammaproteobacteria bacterium]